MKTAVKQTEKRGNPTMAKETFGLLEAINIICELTEDNKKVKDALERIKREMKNANRREQPRTDTKEKSVQNGNSERSEQIPE